MTSNLLEYIFWRLIALIPVVFGVLVITFIIGHIVPADPVHLFIGQEADQELIEQIKKDLHLDQPIWKQFYYYMNDILHGNLGMSWSTRNPVVVDLASRLPATFELITISLIVCVIIALPLGILAAIKRDTWVDHLARIISLLGVAMPGFWLALILIFIFFFKLDLLPPPIGRFSINTDFEQITGFYLIDTLIAGDFKAFKDVTLFLILPVAALSFRKMGQLTRLVRSTMIEALSSDYVQTALSQGLKKSLIYYRLALKNALLPPITQIAVIWGDLIGTAVIIEIVFAWPGVGNWSIDAALAGDFAPVQALAMIAAASNVIIFLITDILYTLIDPRIKF